MTLQPSDRQAWVARAVRGLNANGSWTGRIHIHKLLFVAEVLELANSPFKFELYDYGPYSFGLDEEIVDMELFANLDRTYPKAGYGPKYLLAFGCDSLAEALDPPVGETLDRVAKVLGGRNSQQLELLATCLWAERKDGLAEPHEIIEWVRELKPKYTSEQVQEGLEDARGVAAALGAA